MIRKTILVVLSIAFFMKILVAAIRDIGKTSTITTTAEHVVLFVVLFWVIWVLGYLTNSKNL